MALEQAGLTELSILDKERWIPFDKEVKFLEAAAELSGDDCFGLHLAPTIDLRTTGLIAYVGLAARTLDDAIRNFIHYQRVHNLAMRGELIDDGARVRMRVEYLQPELHKYKQREEMGAGIHVHVARWLTHMDISPVEVRFKHGRNQNREEVERVLGCPVRFGRQAHETIFHRDHLSLPLPTADSQLLKVLTKHADQVLQERAEEGNDFMDVMSERIVDQLSSGRVTIKKIAADLGTSERTLSRRLAEQGISFEQLIDDIRKDLAMRYLNEGKVQLQELAFLLGFSTHASFTSAFKRWTGKTPSETRSMP